MKDNYTEMDMEYPVCSEPHVYREADFVESDKHSYISVADAKQIILQYGCMWGRYTVIRHIRDAASNRPELVAASWRRYSPFTDTYECSRCGYQVPTEDFCSNFCPNCGVAMTEEAVKMLRERGNDDDVFYQS